MQDQFPGRKIPTMEPSRWVEPDEHSQIDRVFGGIPEKWKNPINHLPLDKAPFWGSITYPTKPWEKEYPRNLKLAEALYTGSHHNKRELDHWFDTFMQSPQREAAMIVKGDVGIGKSWWIAHKLSKLPKDKYHTILVDLRFKKRGDELADAIERSLSEFLDYYIQELEWLYPEFRAIYNKDFDPTAPSILSKMRERALNMSLKERNEKRLRYYSFPGSPDLIVAFDNIDHFKETEVLTVLDICRRIIGDGAGIKVIVSARPSTRFPKSRRGLGFGDVIAKTVQLRSPDIFEVLECRLRTNSYGAILRAVWVYDLSSGARWSRHSWPHTRPIEPPHGLVGSILPSGWIPP